MKQLKPIRSSSGDKYFHAIMLEDVHILEEIEAKLTPEGWVIPQWLQDLRKDIEQRK